MRTVAERSRVAALGAAARALRIPERLPVSQWAAKYRRLSAKSSAIPGPWLPERIPFLNAIMDALGPEHPAKQVTFAKASQVGGSECALNWLGSIIHQSPGPVLVLLPTEKLGLRWIRGRLRPMVLECGPLSRLLPLGRHSRSSNTLTELHFAGGVLYLGSANVPADLSSVPIAYLVLDEVDRMMRALVGEGAVTEIAKRRVATFQGRSKVFEISSPTDETSQIDADYRVSSRGRYWVPCPECGEAQPLVWDRVQFPEGKPQLARYACAECAALIDEQAKGEMLARGEWRHEAPELVDEHIGFHVSGLYTPRGLGDSWADHAFAWEAARGQSTKLQVFYNTRLGLVWVGEKRRIEWEELKRRAEPYRLRELAPGIFLLTAGVDVQKDRLEVQVVGWGRGEQATVVDYHVLTGDTTRPEVWQQLDEYLERPLASAGGVPMRVVVTMVDAGYNTDHVYAFTRPRRTRGIFASKGSQIATKAPIGRPSYPDMRKRGRKVERDVRGVELYVLGVSALKTWLFEQLGADVGRDGALVTPAARHFRFAEALGDEYFRQVTSETFDPKRGWATTQHERNEALDTIILARAAAMHPLAGVHKFNEADWSRLEHLYEPKGDAKAAPKQGGGAPPTLPGGGFLPSPAVTST